MPPKKAAVAKADLSPFPPRKENFTINEGFKFGSGDHPPLLNQKPVPTGKPGCLANNRFVITGTLPSLYRESAKALIEKYGGVVTGSISGKTDVLLAGIIEVGPKKIQTAKEKNIPIIDEDGLFLIIARSDPEKNKEFLDKANEKDDDSQDTSTDELSEQIPDTKPANAGENEENTTQSQTKIISIPLVDKYKPTSISEIAGHIGQRAEYTNWLKGFDKSKQKIFLIQGPCGIGKTTIAKLIPQSLGYTVHEFNASDKRSKTEVMQFMDVVNNKMIGKNAKKNDTKSVLLFDEIDGMSSGDRGGLSAICDIAKSTKIPIICTMNDSTDRKYETILKYSKTIKLPGLPTPLIIGRLTEIIKKEGMNVTNDQVRKIAATANGDLRFAINLLQFGIDNVSNGEKFIDYSDVVDATRHLLFKDTNMADRFDMSFADDSMPLYMQYNIQLPKEPSLEDQHNYCDALDACAWGDVIGRELSETQNYSLSLPQNYLACVLPGIISGSKEETIGMVRAEMPKYMTTYSKKKKLEGYQTYFSSLLDIQPNDVFLTLLFIIKNVDIMVERKEYENVISFITALRMTLDDLEHAREFIHLGKKLDYKTPKELSSAYRSVHSDLDYNVIQTAGKKVGKGSDKKDKKDKKDTKDKKKDKKDKKEKKDKKDKKEKKDKKDKKEKKEKKDKK